MAGPELGCLMFTALAHQLPALRTRYAEPHRAYHTQAHIDAMLVGLRDLGSAVQHHNVVELAIWYHDAIYDPARSDNEERSATLMRAELDGFADPSLLNNTGLLVRATANHSIPAGLPDALREDAALFLDLDMAVLGADPATFLAYKRGIAAEYVPVHGAAPFRAGRARFLQATLARPRLFLSDLFHRQLNGAARLNIRVELAHLAAYFGPE